MRRRVHGDVERPGGDHRGFRQESASGDPLTPADEAYRSTRSRAATFLLTVGAISSTARSLRNPTEAVRQLDDALAYMGKTGKQDMIALENRVTTRQLWAWVEAIGRRVEAEAKAAERSSRR